MKKGSKVIPKETLKIVEKLLDGYRYHLEEDYGELMPIEHQKAINEIRVAIGKLPYMLIRDD